MSVNQSVFASKAERAYFHKLSRRWSDKYRIYHNLPFLNVFKTDILFDFSSKDLRHIIINNIELQRLKKTSIDFTLCDQNDKPLVCIEFDGLQEGYNIGTTYRPKHPQEKLADWRKTITELKLKVAHGSLFPYLVVGTRYMNDLPGNLKVAVIDGIIGKIIANIKFGERFSREITAEEMGISTADFDAMSDREQNELIQDFVFGVEIETEMENNPILQKIGDLSELPGLRGSSQSYYFLDYPSVEAAKTDEERRQLLGKVFLQGINFTLRNPTFGEVNRIVWIPKFDTPRLFPLSLCEDIAHLLALHDAIKELKKRGQDVSLPNKQ